MIATAQTGEGADSWQWFPVSVTWSPDGTVLLYGAGGQQDGWPDEGTGTDGVIAVPVTGSSPPVVLYETSDGTDGYHILEGNSFRAGAHRSAVEGEFEISARCLTNSAGSTRNGWQIGDLRPLPRAGLRARVERVAYAFFTHDVVPGPGCPLDPRNSAVRGLPTVGRTPPVDRPGADGYSCASASRDFAPERPLFVKLSGRVGASWVAGFRGVPLPPSTPARAPEAILGPSSMRGRCADSPA